LLPPSRSDLALRQQVQIAVWLTKSHQPRLAPPSLNGWFSTAARHALGAVLDVPHGVGSCVALLPGVRYHAGATRERQRLLARALGWVVEDDGAPLAPGLQQFFAELAVPTRLQDLGHSRAAVDEVVRSIVEESPQLGSAAQIAAVAGEMW
jgi:alcohol dehydrogenase class IV